MEANDKTAPAEESPVFRETAGGLSGIDVASQDKAQSGNLEPSSDPVKDEDKPFKLHTISR